jgi:hypothetical protein
MNYQQNIIMKKNYAVFRLSPVFSLFIFLSFFFVTATESYKHQKPKRLMKTGSFEIDDGRTKF